MNSILIFLINISIPHAVGAISTYLTINYIRSNWFIFLNKPSFNPPSWIFSPVWLTLYTIIGISFYLFYKKDKFNTKKVYILYSLHLFLNGIWSIVFFRMQNIFFAFLISVMLVLTLIILMKWIYKINKTSSYLLNIYLAWISFACFLTYNLLILN